MFCLFYLFQYTTVGCAYTVDTVIVFFFNISDKKLIRGRSDKTYYNREKVSMDFSMNQEENFDNIKKMSFWNTPVMYAKCCGQSLGEFP